MSDFCTLDPVRQRALIHLWLTSRSAAVDVYMDHALRAAGAKHPVGTLAKMTLHTTTEQEHEEWLRKHQQAPCLTWYRGSATERPLITPFDVSMWLSHSLAARMFTGGRGHDKHRIAALMQLIGIERYELVARSCFGLPDAYGNRPVSETLDSLQVSFRLPWFVMERDELQLLRINIAAPLYSRGGYVEYPVDQLFAALVQEDTHPMNDWLYKSVTEEVELVVDPWVVRPDSYSMNDPDGAFAQEMSACGLPSAQIHGTGWYLVSAPDYKYPQLVSSIHVSNAASNYDGSRGIPGSDVYVIA